MNSDFEPVNFETYFYDIDAPHPAWEREYNLKQSYQLQKAKTLYQAYQLLYNKLFSLILRYTAESNKQPIAHGAWLPYYYCAIDHNTKTSFKDCVNRIDNNIKTKAAKRKH